MDRKVNESTYSLQDLMNDNEEEDEPIFSRKLKRKKEIQSMYESKSSKSKTLPRNFQPQRSISKSVSGSVVKCVVIGDTCACKTELLLNYSGKKYAEDYVPTLFDNFKVKIKVSPERLQKCSTLNLNAAKSSRCKEQLDSSLDDQEMDIEIYDTTGQESYPRLRQLGYKETDVFILCFSLVSRKSFENIENLWEPEARCFCPNASLILVGTQMEKRRLKQEKNAKTEEFEYVSLKEGSKMASKLNAVAYFECSAAEHVGLHEIFQEVARASIKPLSATIKPKNRRQVCRIH